LAGISRASLIPTPPGSPAFDADIDVVNDTRLDVTIVVNGTDRGVVSAFAATSRAKRKLRNAGMEFP